MFAEYMFLICYWQTCIFLVTLLVLPSLMSYCITNLELHIVCSFLSRQIWGQYLLPEIHDLPFLSLASVMVMLWHLWQCVSFCSGYFLVIPIVTQLQYTLDNTHFFNSAYGCRMWTTLVVVMTLKMETSGSCLCRYYLCLIILK